MVNAEFASLKDRLRAALAARQDGLSQDMDIAVRLFNGFYEGYPDLVVDLYADTLLLWDYCAAPSEKPQLLDQVQTFYLQQLPRIRAAVRKVRVAADPAQRNGILVYGQSSAQKVSEHGVWYALDLTLQQDASFYLDTRWLRRWLIEHAADWQVLNTFAYTGSLGIAALAGGAARVLQTDRSRKFLELSYKSAALNRLDTGCLELAAGDFFRQVARLRRSDDLFDCVILDPPFFATSPQGTVDQVGESSRLVNKVRPLVKDGGFLVAVNNALYISGVDFYRSLEALCQDGYLAIDQLIPVPPEITGYPQTVVAVPPLDPAPFNHPTKIAVLRVRRK